MKRFGKKLSYLRNKKKLTIRELASALEIKSSGYITNLEKGKQNPSALLILKISRFFNISTDKLMKDELDIE